MEVLGKIKMIDTTKEVGSGGFKKRDIVVTTNEQYPQHILIQFVQDKVDLLDGFTVGENVKIDINLKGREWINTKDETVYFNTIQGWKINKEKIDEPEPITQPKKEIKEGDFVNPKEEEADDLPFN